MSQRRFIFGEWDEGELTAEKVAEIGKLARSRQEEIQKYPLDRVFAVFRKLQEKWGDPNYVYRKKLLTELPAETGFSKEMIELALNEIVWTLDPTLLRRKIDTELQGTWPESKFISRTGRRLTFHPLGTILHVLSGNVFLVAIGSWVEGVITGNVNILKMSSGERLFLPLFIESLKECDTEGVLFRSLAVVDYRSSAKPIIAAFKEEVDGIVVWGGEEAVKAYRNDLPARVRAIVFGPKLSFSLVTRAGLDLTQAETVAARLADEVAIWDQNACTAPQLVYVETKEAAEGLAEQLARALEAKAKMLPAGPAETNTAVEIQKMRSVAEVAEVRGLGRVFESANNVDWTVIVDGSLEINPSPLHRTIRVVPYEKLYDITGEMRKLQGYLQTVGLCAGKGEADEIARVMRRAGALRVLPINQMSGGEIDDPHDGQYDLSQFGHFVFEATGSEWTSGVHKQETVDARLRTLIARAKSSPYYGSILSGIEINGVADLPKIPILSRELMENGMPPAVKEGEGLATTRIVGGYVSRSGGSTGKPKFSLYNEEDWENMIAEAEKVLRAAGLQRGDRVANCMLAGDLYGSFVSFDHINNRVGALTFAFSGKVDAETLLEVARQFKINVIQGMPTFILPLLRRAKELDPKFTIEKVIYAGIPMSPSDRQWLIDELKVHRVASIIGANDGGQLAFQCEELTGAFHHLVDDFNYVEILDEENRPVADGEAGKIVLTSLKKFAYPLIRYEIGDAGRIVPGRCRCGRDTRVIEYLGRSDDTICIGLMNIRYRDLSSAVSDLPIATLQMVGRNDAKGEILVARAEVAAGAGVTSEEIRTRILNRIPAIPEHIKAGHVRFEVELLPPGGIERNARTGKVKQWLDERK